MARLNANVRALMREFRFNVFGRLIAIKATDNGWEAFVLGAAGKRRPAEFVVPEFIPAEGLCQYLADLFHECATPTNGDVTQIQ
jgi:hypothetical protein